jgi:hypothetical protein
MNPGKKPYRRMFRFLPPCIARDGATVFKQIGREFFPSFILISGTVFRLALEQELRHPGSG